MQLVRDGSVSEAWARLLSESNRSRFTVQEQESLSRKRFFILIFTPSHSYGLEVKLFSPDSWEQIHWAHDFLNNFILWTCHRRQLKHGYFTARGHWLQGWCTAYKKGLNDLGTYLGVLFSRAYISDLQWDIGPCGLTSTTWLLLNKLNTNAKGNR